MAAPEDSNLIDRSYSFIKVKDLQNGQSEALMGPARISTIVMIVLLLIGMMYPCYILYKRIFSCLTKQRQSNTEVGKIVRNDSIEPTTIKEQPRFRRVNTMVAKRDLEGETQDDRDCRVLTAIADQEVKFKRETDTISRDERIKELEREIRALNTSRMSV